MSRYIDADKLCEGRVSNDFVVIAVSCEPTADVKPVVRGEWIELGICYYCSICNGEVVNTDLLGYAQDFDFCPHCGADMRGEKNE